MRAGSHCAGLPPLAALAESRRLTDRIHCVDWGDHVLPVDGGSACDLRAAVIAVDSGAAAHRPFRPRPPAPTSARVPPVRIYVHNLVSGRQNPFSPDLSTRAVFALTDLFAAGRCPLPPGREP